MTPAQMVAYLRWETSINTVAPFDNATLLPIINIAKDNVAQAIVQVNPDYFGEVSTAATVSSQQEYTKPTGLMIMKRIDVSYTDTLPGSYRNARIVTLNDLRPLGEDYYANFQSTTDPMVRFDDTGFFLYPIPGLNSSPVGSAFLRLWWVPKRTDLTDLSDASTDIETTTGIGGIFHQLIADIVLNWIRNKQGTLASSDVQIANQKILDVLVPSAFRKLSTPASTIPDDTVYQI